MWPSGRLAVCPCVWQPTPKTADVTVTKIAGYVRVPILMIRWFFSYFGIHSFYATATLLNILICMQWTDAADSGCGGGLDFAPMHAIHRYTRPNCNNIAITGISHMSLALLNRWSGSKMRAKKTDSYDCDRNAMTQNGDAKLRAKRTNRNLGNGWAMVRKTKWVLSSYHVHQSMRT